MLQSIRIKNFKALRDTGTLTLPELAVFIGNNGSGKSSVIEALKVLQSIINHGIQIAFEALGSLEDVRHYQSKYNEPFTTQNGFKRVYEPIEFEVNAILNQANYNYTLLINTNQSGDLYVVESEVLMRNSKIVFSRKANEKDGFSAFHYDEGSNRKEYGEIYPLGASFTKLTMADSDSEPSNAEFANFIRSWQFLNLNAHLIGLPTPQDKTTTQIRLKDDAANLADFVRYLALTDADFLPLLISKMQFVLPYADTIRSKPTGSRKDEFMLEMFEQNQQTDPIPGWLFSGGTLRILALLAVLNQPKLPSVLFVDEIENGLDPRTIGLLLSEIRTLVMDNQLQVIATTHSPYFLDLVELRHVIVAEKQGANTTFAFPDSDESLTNWKQKFSPGKLYTMGSLTKQ